MKILHIKNAIFASGEISGARVHCNNGKWGIVVHLKYQSPAWAECESEDDAWNALNTFEKAWQQALTAEENDQRLRDQISKDWVMATQQVATEQAVMKKELAAMSRSLKRMEKELETTDVLPIPIKYDPEKPLTIYQEKADGVQGE
jgi:alpha-mannosidase